jgi:hypothetical protein
MKNKQILYTIIIYKKQNKLKVINNKNNIVFETKYNDDNEMYNKCLKVSRLCDDIDKINIIFK